MPAAEVARPTSAPWSELRDHRLVALPEYPFEELKIGAGPPPIRVDEGWLLIHHGVTGHMPEGWDPTTQQRPSTPRAR